MGLGCRTRVGTAAPGREVGLSAASMGCWKGRGTGNLGPAGDVTDTAGPGEGGR